MANDTPNLEQEMSETSNVITGTDEELIIPAQENNERQRIELEEVPALCIPQIPRVIHHRTLYPL